MAINAYLSFFDKADGESVRKGHERTVDVLGWDWDVEAPSISSLEGGASAGRPRPGAFRWSHHFDSTSTVLLRSIAVGSAFPKIELQHLRPGQSLSSPGKEVLFLTITLQEVLVTRLGQAFVEGERILQTVEMHFQMIDVEYRGPKATVPQTLSWDIPAGTASPSA